MNAPERIMTPVGEIDRRTYIGGADAAAIIGLGATYRGRRQTAYTVWARKTSDQPEELDPDLLKFFKNRKRYEAVIVEQLREEYDGEIVSVNHRYRDPEHDFLAAEIDFEWRDPSDGSIQNGEIKTVHPLAFGETKGWGEPGTDQIPVNYTAQVMHGLMVTGRRKTICAALVGFDDMLFYPVERDEEMIAEMRKQEVRFFLEHVLPKVPPAPQDSDDIKALYARVNGRPIQINPQVAEKISTVAKLRGSIKAFEEELETVQFEVAKFVCGELGLPADTEANKIDNTVLMLGDRKVATWNKQRGASLDQKRFKAEHPELHAGYMREHWFRPLRISK